MAITRTPIIDDDGTGTTGTVIDNAWKTEFYNQIDATLGVSSMLTWAFTAGQSVVNNWDPGLTGAGVLQYGGGGPASTTITGLKPLARGTVITILNAGIASVLYFAHQDGRSSAAYQFYNTLTSTPIAINDGGAATFIYNGSSWVLLNHEQGKWIQQAFSASNFWTGVTAGMIITNQYAIVHRNVFWMLQIAGAPAPAPGSGTLDVALPGTATLAPGGMTAPVSYCNDGAGVQPGLLVASSLGSRYVGIQKLAGGLWTGAACYGYFSAIIPIN